MKVRRINMTMKKMFKIGSIFFVISFFMISLAQAQQKGAQPQKADIIKMPDGSYRAKGYDEATRPDDSYLAKFHAMEVVRKLMKQNLEEIYLIKVIVSNFPDKGWNADYDKLYNGYKEGMELYYKRNIIYSQAKLEQNQKDIRDLFKKIIDEYKIQAETLLGECASKVLQLHLDVSSRIDPNRFDALYTNQLRLRVAYGQLDDAESAVWDKYYVGAIYHLRLARAYAISILEDLSATPQEREAVENKYKVAKADDLNRIYAEKPVKKEEPVKK
jgi:hypothetical protein